MSQLKKLGALMGGCIAIAACIIILRPQDIRQVIAPNLENEPDLLLEDVRILTYLHRGKVAYELTAERVEQRLNVSSMSFDELQLNVQQEQGALWTFHAKSGLLQINEQNPERISHPVMLRDNVLVQSEGIESGDYRFEGSNMTYHPESYRLASDQPVHFNQGTWFYSAGGFEVDLSTEEFKFTSSTDQRVNLNIKKDDADD